MIEAVVIDFLGAALCCTITLTLTLMYHLVTRSRGQGYEFLTIDCSAIRRTMVLNHL